MRPSNDHAKPPRRLSPGRRAASATVALLFAVLAGGAGLLGGIAGSPHSGGDATLREVQLQFAMLLVVAGFLAFVSMLLAALTGRWTPLQKWSSIAALTLLAGWLTAYFVWAATQSAAEV